MAEAVGLALAIVPLVASTLKHYRDFYHILHRFYHFDAALARFENVVETQRCIFHQEALYLVSCAIGDDSQRNATNADAERLLLAADSTTWEDPAVNEQVDEYLGASKNALNTTVQMIRDALVELQEGVYDSAKAPANEPRVCCIYVHTNLSIPRIYTTNLLASGIALRHVPSEFVNA